MSEFQYNPHVRGGGRSTHQIMSAPQKFVFVVNTWGMINHARTLQRKHAPDKDMDIVTVNDLYKFQGTTIPIVVDHHTIDSHSIPPHLLDWLRDHTSRYNP